MRIEPLNKGVFILEPLRMKDSFFEAKEWAIKLLLQRRAIKSIMDKLDL